MARTMSFRLRSRSRETTAAAADHSTHGSRGLRLPSWPACPVAFRPGMGACIVRRLMRGRPIDGVLWRGKAMSSASGTSTISEAGGAAASSVQRPFSLLRWFSIFSFAALVIVGIAIALFLTRYLTAHMLMRDAEVSRDFIESILTTEKGHDSLAHRQPGEPASDLDPFIEHLPTLPDVLRTNFYGVDRTVIWSRDRKSTRLN